MRFMLQTSFFSRTSRPIPAVLEVGGIDVRAIKLDSGAAKVEITLPRPRGVVPIEVSGGVVGLNIHRPRGVAAAADISTGAVRIKLDDYSVKAAVIDSQWESADGAAAVPDRYQLAIKGGAVQVTLDSEAKAVPAVKAEVPVETPGEQVSALDILLDGVESRVRRGGDGWARVLSSPLSSRARRSLPRRRPGERGLKCDPNR